MSDLNKYEIVSWGKCVVYDGSTGEKLFEFEPLSPIICPVCLNVLEYRHNKTISELYCSKCGFSVSIAPLNTMKKKSLN